jgi:hypothetical protein
MVFYTEDLAARVIEAPSMIKENNLKYWLRETIPESLYKYKRQLAEMVIVMSQVLQQEQKNEL